MTAPGGHGFKAYKVYRRKNGEETIVPANQEAKDDRRKLAARRTSLIRQSDTIGSSGRRSPAEVTRAKADLERTTRGVEAQLEGVEGKGRAAELGDERRRRVIKRRTK